MLKAKIHRATVTGAHIDYEGSISLDVELMRLADIAEWEQVAVLDIDNGARLETYAIAGGPGEVRINGAAARLVDPGDRVIVLTYADYEEADLASGYRPTIVLVDDHNRPVDPGLPDGSGGGGHDPGHLAHPGGSGARGARLRAVPDQLPPT